MDSNEADEPISGDQIFTISNEFALVNLRKIRTRNGERLEISAPKSGSSIRLDAILLESLTWQKPKALSKLLEHPVKHNASDDIENVHI